MLLGGHVDHQFDEKFIGKLEHGDIFVYFYSGPVEGFLHPDLLYLLEYKVALSVRFITFPLSGLAESHHPVYVHVLVRALHSLFTEGPQFTILSLFLDCVELGESFIRKL